MFLSLNQKNGYHIIEVMNLSYYVLFLNHNKKKSKVPERLAIDSSSLCLTYYFIAFFLFKQEPSRTGIFSLVCLWINTMACLYIIACLI